MQSIYRVEQGEGALLDELEALDDSKSNKTTFDRRPYLTSFLKCVRQMEPIIFIAIFIVCGFRALTS
jgi:hypothetical protein